MTYLPASDRYDKLDVSPDRAERPEAAGDLARALAQFRRERAARAGADDAPHRLRPRHHPFRSRQQLRSAAGRGGDVSSAASCATDFRGYRDELIISTKAGYRMWPGPYGEWGSRKYLLVEPRPEPEADGARLCRHLLFAPRRPQHAARGDDGRARHGGAPGQGALCRHLVLQCEADARRRRRSSATSARRCLIHQPSYSMLNRWIEEDKLLDTLEAGGHRLHRLLAAGAGHADRQVSRRRAGGQPRRERLRRLAAGLPRRRRTSPRSAASTTSPQRRGQTLAQMAIAWVLRDPRVTSALIGASRPEQIVDAVGALAKPDFAAGRARRDRPLRHRRRRSTSGGCRRRRRAVQPVDRAPVPGSRSDVTGASLATTAPARQCRTG